MSEQHSPADSSNWDEWIAVNPDPRKRGSEVLNRIHDSEPLSPREAAIADYAHRRSAEYRDMGVEEDLIARIQIDLMGTFLCGADQAYDGELANIAQLSDERPTESQEAIE